MKLFYFVTEGLFQTKGEIAGSFIAGKCDKEIALISDVQGTSSDYDRGTAGRSSNHWCESINLLLIQKKHIVALESCSIGEAYSVQGWLRQRPATWRENPS